MLSFICKKLPYVKFSARISQAHELNFLQNHPFSSSSSSSSATTLKSISKKSDHRRSFAVSYLINTFGFPPERALSASKYINFENPEKPDSVVGFLAKHGFAKTQISTLISRFPQVLRSSPEKTLLPKFDFFLSKGLSSVQIIEIVSTSPGILNRSLKNHIIPSYDFCRNLIKCEEKTILAMKRLGRLVSFDYKGFLVANFAILQEAGVPEANIVGFVTNHPRNFTTNPEKFKEIVKEVQKMGFNPVTVTFTLAIKAFTSMSKLNWEKKVEVFKKWGWSDDEFLVAFGKHPWCIMVSEKKIMKIMEYLVNEIGCKSSDIARMPTVLSLSLERTIVPRCSIYQILLSKGLIKKDISFTSLLKSPEKWFLNKFVKNFEEAAPELLQVYQEKLTPSK